MNKLEKVARFERYVWYKYTIDQVPLNASKENQRDYLSGIVKSIRKNRGVPLDERRTYLKIIRKKLEEIK